MSRVGQKPIKIPDGVTITVDGATVKTKGPLGELEVKAPSYFEIKQENNILTLAPKKKGSDVPAMWGLYRTLVANAVNGVAKGFEKKLEIEGVGYRAETKGDTLVLNLGYSHPIEMKIPENIKVETDKSSITISGPNKYVVGQFAADIRAKRKPEPYKGKGIKYEGEHIRRKAGKRAVTGPGAA